MPKTQHLLVIRLSAMGDVAMTIPVLLALTKKNPELHITILTKAFFKPLFNEIPKVSVFVADIKGRHKGAYGLYKLYKELKFLQIDGVADLHQVLRSSILKQFFKLGGYNVVQIDKGRKSKKALTSGNRKEFKQLKSTHERYAQVFEKLGYKVILSKEFVLPKRALNNNLIKLIDKAENKLIGVAPFAAFEGKTYPIDLMEKIIASLSQKSNYSLLLFGGGEKEKAILDTWEDKYEHTISIVGKITFSEELDLISNLDVMLAMDSGNAHLAAMFGVKTLTLWGVTHPYAGFYPFAQSIDNAMLSDREKYPLIPTSVYGNKMPESYKNVMRTIQPNDVINKIEKLLINKN